MPITLHHTSAQWVFSRHPSMTTTSKLTHRNSRLYPWHYLHTASPAINLLQPHQLLWLFFQISQAFSCLSLVLSVSFAWGKGKGNFSSFSLPSKSAVSLNFISTDKVSWIIKYCSSYLMAGEEKLRKINNSFETLEQHSAEDWKWECSYSVLAQSLLYRNALNRNINTSFPHPGKGEHYLSLPVICLSH